MMQNKLIKQLMTTREEHDMKREEEEEVQYSWLLTAGCC